LLKEGRIHAEFQCQRAPEALAQFRDQLAHKNLGTLGVVDVAGTIVEPQDLSGLGQVGEQRVVTGNLPVMGVKAARRPRHFSAGANYRTLKVDSQSGQLQLLDLLIEQFAVEPRQRAQRSLGKLLKPVDYCAITRHAGQPAQPREQRILGDIAQVAQPAPADHQQTDHQQHQPTGAIIAT
jgi:hypothetical protein